jgi:uncharacterized spore protein YtfJ
MSEKNDGAEGRVKVAGEGTGTGTGTGAGAGAGMEPGANVTGPDVRICVPGLPVNIRNSSTNCSSIRHA